MRRGRARDVAKSGKTSAIPLQWTGERNGRCRATLTTFDTGWYEASGGHARRPDLGTGVTHVRTALMMRIFRRGDARAP
jgi:hypothetical protein